MLSGRLDLDQCLTAIEVHTRGLAEAAQGSLGRRVQHCPDWSVADLVHHLTEVHTFWEYVARERPLDEPAAVPDLLRRPDDELVPGMIAAMEALVATLRSADQGAACWTWAEEQTVGFITRHQVQEAAVHHWDAANAARVRWEMDPLAAIDAVEEFLTCSVANPKWPMPDAEPLGGSLWFCACLTPHPRCPVWHVTDGDVLGTLALTTYDGEAPEPGGGCHGDHVDPAALLLWLYRRRPDDDPEILGPLDAEGRAMVERFRALSSTD